MMQGANRAGTISSGGHGQLGRLTATGPGTAGLSGAVHRIETSEVAAIGGQDTPATLRNSTVQAGASERRVGDREPGASEPTSAKVPQSPATASTDTPEQTPRSWFRRAMIKVDSHLDTKPKRWAFALVMALAAVGITVASGGTVGIAIVAGLGVGALAKTFTAAAHEVRRFTEAEEAGSAVPEVDLEALKRRGANQPGAEYATDPLDMVENLMALASL